MPKINMAGDSSALFLHQGAQTDTNDLSPYLKSQEKATQEDSIDLSVNFRLSWDQKQWILQQKTGEDFATFHFAQHVRG